MIIKEKIRHPISAEWKGAKQIKKKNKLFIIKNSNAPCVRPTAWLKKTIWKKDST